MGVNTKRSLAAHPHTTPKSLLKLAKHKDNEVRRLVAANPHTSPEALLILCRDEDMSVRNMLTTRRDLPVEAMCVLATDESNYVKWGLAINQSTTPEALVLLAENISRSSGNDPKCFDSNQNTVNLLLRHPNTPEPVKIWFKNNGFAGMSLREFLDSVNGD